MDISVRLHVVCEFCACDLNREDRNTYRRGTGWFKNRQSKGGGTHGVALVDWTTHFACKWCIEKKLSGIPIGQQRLFDLDEP